MARFRLSERAASFAVPIESQNGFSWAEARSKMPIQSTQNRKL
jgi:hypothetical protein